MPRSEHCIQTLQRSIFVKQDCSPHEQGSNRPPNRYSEFRKVAQSRYRDCQPCAAQDMGDGRVFFLHVNMAVIFFFEQ